MWLTSIIYFIFLDIEDMDNGKFICTLIGEDGTIQDSKTVDVTVIRKSACAFTTT